MAVNEINAGLLAKMFLAGAQNLDAKKEWINELNVFPVPDGDTGTNMTMTIMSAAREVQAADQADMKALAKAISSGSLRGARGNSGVILSQLLRGFTKVVRESESVGIRMIAKACEKAVETAYKAVMKPKEGTILTVARGMADKALELSETEIGLEDYIRQIIAYGNDVLARTPDMLPVLKEAGVVDSGGQGLMTVLEGAFDALLGKELNFDSIPAAGPVRTSAADPAPSEIKFGYCTEFIVNLDHPLPEKEVEGFRDFLLSIGDSLVLVPDSDLVKIHVHTNDPGAALSRALKYGPLTNMKIDNMRVEHQEKLIKESEKLARLQAEQAAAKAEPPKEVGFVAVSAGEGFEEIFKGLNVDHVISGGQTMNPSTEDVLNAIDQVNARNIFLFPNNKNIILAANQARDLVKEKAVIVIPTKTVPQGITAVIGYDPDSTVEENQAAMMEAIGLVRTAEVTYAVRDTRIDEIDIHQGDIMSVGDGGILAVGSDIIETAMESVRKMAGEEAELISVYYGADFSEEKAAALGRSLEEAYPSCDVEVNYGGQPVYYCVISVE